jgi:hypothetical protein
MNAKLRLEKDGQSILTVDDWKRLAPPKSKGHWVEGRSALELAKAWCGSGSPAMPSALQELLESRHQTQGLTFDRCYPEHRIAFDTHKGEPRNADLALVGTSRKGKVAITIEAKADESFGAKVSTTLSDALERFLETPKSMGIRRVEGLACSLFSPWIKGLPKTGGLRYQLLTAAAGTLRFAITEGASVAVLVVHEFATDKTLDRRHAQNTADYGAFVHRLSGVPQENNHGQLLGPFTIPGAPLFETTPSFFIGKIVTRTRQR